MRTPTVHLNGTSKAELERLNYEAYKAVNAAIDALCNACPNGRDYYPQGNQAISEAMQEHQNRINALFAVKTDLEAILEVVSE
jgi:hypothetical protein